MKIKKFISLLLAAMLTVTSNFNCSAMISDSDCGFDGSVRDFLSKAAIKPDDPSWRDKLHELEKKTREGNVQVVKLNIAHAEEQKELEELDRTRVELKRYKDGTKPTHPCPVLKNKIFYEGAAAGGIVVTAIAMIGIGVYTRIAHTCSNHK